MLHAGITAETFRDKTPIKCLRSISFWMLIAINGIGSGAGLTLLNNLGEEVSHDSCSNAGGVGWSSVWLGSTKRVGGKSPVLLVSCCVVSQKGQAV